ncbi:unnamed protein product [Effrenium voratum]|nr:unnamed protein product [Effrenium voratum]
MAAVLDFDPNDPQRDLRVAQFVQRCLQDNRNAYVFAVSTGTVAFLTTLTLTCRQHFQLDERPICLLRSYYHGILIFPLVWAATSWLTLFCPLTSPLADLFQGQAEAYAIYVFLVILYMLASIEAVKKELEQNGERGGPETLRSEVQNMGRTIIQAIAEFGPKKYFAVPPLGCCLRCFGKPHTLTATQLLWVSRFVKQYVVLQIFLNTFFMWCLLSFRASRAARLLLFSGYFLKFSGLLAVYGLFVMYKATHELLADWNTTRKFVSIKIVILLSIVQKKLITWFIRAIYTPEKTCLINPYEPKDLDHLINFWTQWLILLETVVLVKLIGWAFPPHEVSDYPLKNLDLVELELRQLQQQKRAACAADVSSDDDFSEDTD